jgi:hypothetical protein
LTVTSAQFIHQLRSDNVLPTTQFAGEASIGQESRVESASIPCVAADIRRAF